MKQTQKSLNIAINHTIDFDNRLDGYLLTTPNWYAMIIDNQTFDLPLHYTINNSPVTTINIYKSANSSRVYLNVSLNQNYLYLFPFSMKSKVAPFLQFQYTITDTQKITKDCYSNLPKIYLPHNCYPAF